ncbi:hypothetical protein MW887_007352 [Aspergillus wentii]|nr:hypothetical protein MW887_007352 [Aspergillus wentii]
MWAEPLNPSAQVFKHSPAPKRRRISPSPSSPAYSGGFSESLPSPSFTLSTCLSTPSPVPSEYDGAIEIYSPSNTNRQYDEHDESTKTTHLDYLSVIPKPAKHISHLSNIETHYLQYHMEQGSKLLANLESDENPLRALLIPRALSSPLLMKAVCAVSAIHLANRSYNSMDAQTTAADYYIRTIKGLRTSMAGCSAGVFPDEAILTVALLCKYEIVRGSVKQWAVHLNALQKLVTARGGLASLDRDTAEFLWGLCMYAHNVAKITNRGQINGTISSSDTVSITKLDTYVGYTEEIIKICAKIADLPFLGSDSLSVGLEVNMIDEALRNWTHTTTQYILPKGITQACLLRLRMVADCFRDAAYIYLHSTLEKMNQDCSQKLSSTWSRFVSLSKTEALQRCLARVESFPLDAHCEYSALTFPLFIAGCESETSAERDLVIRSLSSLERNFGIGNVKRAKELLTVLWKGSGMHWLDVLEQLQWDLILA